MHGAKIWRYDSLHEALDFAAAHDLTALVLHDNSIIHSTTLPKQYFDDSKRKGFAHVRRYLSTLYCKQAYLRDLLKHAKRKGIEVWVEVKELEFPDEILERFPQLTKNGVVCPTDPVWFEYLKYKTEEFFEFFPEIAGIILSPGSPESRAFLSAGKKCTCETCQKTEFGDWCYQIIMSIYNAMAPYGKRLAVRDFVYTPEDHERLSGIISRTPADVILCMKITPRDFWPTFPTNPLIGRMKDRTQWIEYDTFGQFYGWGLCPSITVKDIKERFAFAKSQGVSGVMLRTEWEGVPISSFDTINKINLIAGAGLAKELDQDETTFVRSWLREKGFDGEAVDISGLTQFLLRTWPIMKKSIYVDGFVFATSSQFPIDVNKAWYTMSFYHCLSTWDQSAAGRISLDDANLRRLLREKDEAYSEITELLQYLDNHDFGLAPPAYEELQRAFQFYERYVRGFGLVVKAALLAKAIGYEPEALSKRKEWADLLEGLLGKLAEYILELKAFEESTSHIFYVYLLLNYRNANGIYQQAKTALADFRKG
jgi:hypothetical protein